MPHPANYHMALMAGDLMGQVAMLKARVEELEEQLAALRASPAQPSVAPGQKKR